jgi:hypothetical protein
LKRERLNTGGFSMEECSEWRTCPKFHRASQVYI